MWTNENRTLYDRSKLRYPSDLTDEEWALVEPMIPPAKRGGRQTNGCHARCRERRDVYSFHRRACVAPGTFATLHVKGMVDAVERFIPIPKVEIAMHRAARRVFGKSPPLATGGDHRQPEREKRGKRGRSIDPCGYDAGKKIKGKKRHVLVDTQGLLMHAVHAADIQDRDGGVPVMASSFGLYPFLLKLYADGGYQGAQFKAALQRVMRQVNLEIVKRSDTANTFVVLPKRWIVERTIGWLNRCRRLAKDWECLNRNALAFLRWASIRLIQKTLSLNTMISDGL